MRWQACIFFLHLTRFLTCTVHTYILCHNTNAADPKIYVLSMVLQLEFISKENLQKNSLQKMQIFVDI